MNGRLSRLIKTKRFLIGAAIFALAFACTSGRDQGSPATSGLVVCIPKAPAILDPRIAGDAVSQRVMRQIYNGLVKKGPDMAPVPDLAERWGLEDEKTWIFDLKKGVRFHTGRELTAEDVVYTYGSMLEAVQPASGHPLNDIIESIQPVSRYRLRFKTKTPFAPLPSSLVTGIVPADSGLPPGEEAALRPAGTGPYRFGDILPDGDIELLAFDKYFRGKPGARRLMFRPVPDETTRYLDLLKGRIDLVQNAIAPRMVPVLENKEQFRVLRCEGANYDYIGFNLKDRRLSNRPVRMAIAHALNIPDMIDDVLSRLGRPATGMLPSNHWAYEPDVPRYPYNPGLARRLLDEAGFQEREDGVRFTLVYKTTPDEPNLRKAEAVQAYLKAVGIRVDIQTLEPDAFSRDLNAGDFQMYSLQQPGVSDPDSYHAMLSSTAFPPAGANVTHYSNADMDRLLEAGRRTFDPEARKALYSRVQKLAAEDLPVISLWHPDNVAVMKQDIAGFEPRPDGDFYNLWQARRQKPADSK